MGLYSWGCNAFGQLALEGGSNTNTADDDFDDNNRANPTKGIQSSTYILEFKIYIHFSED